MLALVPGAVLFVVTYRSYREKRTFRDRARVVAGTIISTTTHSLNATEEAEVNAFEESDENRPFRTSAWSSLDSSRRLFRELQLVEYRAEGNTCYTSYEGRGVIGDRRAVYYDPDEPTYARTENQLHLFGWHALGFLGWLMAWTWFLTV